MLPSAWDARPVLWPVPKPIIRTCLMLKIPDGKVCRRTSGAYPPSSPDDPLNCLSNASSVRMRPASRSVRTACPYDARWMHPKTGLPVKCMGKGCESLLKAGKDPACVAACPASARAFGDINDPSSAISQRLQHGRSERLMPQKGTRPNFFVVVNK